MRMLLGIVLGIAITIGGAYLYDSHNALDAASNAAPRQQQSLVNWDVASQKWNVLSDRARVQWDRLTVRARTEWTRHAG